MLNRPLTSCKTAPSTLHNAITTPSSVGHNSFGKSPTLMHYKTFQDAYEYFNVTLFSNALPHVMITMQRGKAYRGYFWAEKFTGRNDDTIIINEIALNPDTFEKLSDREVLSVLVHEQAHCWQHEHGEPARKGYHDKEWAHKMKEVGLYPSSTGAQGGKETGQKVSHYIIEGGAFDKACGALLATGFKLEWNSHVAASMAASKGKAAPTRAKFVCTICHQQAMAKPSARLACGACSGDTGIKYMVIG